MPISRVAKVLGGMTPAARKMLVLSGKHPACLECINVKLRRLVGDASRKGYCAICIRPRPLYLVHEGDRVDT